MFCVFLILFFNCTTTSILLYKLSARNTIIAFYALASLCAFHTRTSAFTVPFLAVGFLAVTAFSRGPLLLKLSNVLGHYFLWVLSLGLLTLLVLLVIVATNTDAILTARDSLREAFAIHFETSCFLAMASLFPRLYFLNLELGNLFNLSKLRCVFIFGTLREKIDILTIAHNEFQGIFGFKNEILGCSLGRTFDAEQCFNCKELLLLIIHELLKGEFTN